MYTVIGTDTATATYKVTFIDSATAPVTLTVMVTVMTRVTGTAAIVAADAAAVDGLGCPVPLLQQRTLKLPLQAPYLDEG